MENKVGIKLQKIIDELEITPEHFSLNIGVGKSSIYKVLRGDTKKITKTLAEKINAFYPQFSISKLLSLNHKTQLDTLSVVKNADNKFSGLKETPLSEEHKGIISNAFLVSRTQAMEIPVVQDIIENERLKTKIEILTEFTSKKDKN
ncbi:hypothetical protein [uncultured Algibacter sp.]|uniref:hypothetical protein n=1 Tax=uncultured Algibacter sp. TaxID=298659 RepID=UPI003217B3B6